MTMATSGTTPTATSTNVTRFMRRISMPTSRSSAIAVELISEAAVEEEAEDSTIPMKTLPMGAFTGLAGLVVRGLTVERTDVNTVVRSILEPELESVVGAYCVVRGVASQLAVLLQKIIKLF